MNSFESIRLRFAIPVSKPAGILSMEARLLGGQEAFQVKDFSFEMMPGTSETDRLVSAVLAAGIGARVMVERVLVDVHVVADKCNDEGVWSTVLPVIGGSEVAIAESRQSITALLKDIKFERPAALPAEPFHRVLAAYALVVTVLLQMGYITSRERECTMLDLEASLLFDGIRGV
ncbi:hypothetical protein ACFSM5_11215 [Lacibacterium aquatile]|uniref:Uncharacterized protein n=1 Tax=Lacibacterium aquatile TaxID=1168082 RepID=A0ABW5DUH2_9PROT